MSECETLTVQSETVKFFILSDDMRSSEEDVSEALACLSWSWFNTFLVLMKFYVPEGKVSLSLGVV